MATAAEYNESHWLFEQLVRAGAAEPRCSEVEAALLASGAELSSHRGWWHGQMAQDANLTQAFIAFAQGLVSSGEAANPGPVGHLSQALDALDPSTTRLWMLVELLDRLYPAVSDGLLGLRRHAIQVAASAAVIANDVGQVAPGELFFAGLIHDHAQVTLLEHGGDAYAEIMAHPAEIDGAELELLGFDHGTLGAGMGRVWGLPRALVNLLRDHHLMDLRQTQVALGSHLRRVAALTLAECLVGGMGYTMAGLPGFEADLKAAQGVLGLRNSERKALEKRCRSAIAGFEQALMGRSRPLFVPVAASVRELWGWGSRRWNRGAAMPEFEAPLQNAMAV